jgi:hypothetical protein
VSTTNTTPAQTFKPFRPQSGKYNGQTIDSNGCYLGNLSGGKRDTCRWVANVDSNIKDNDYAIDCDVTLGNRSTDNEWPHDDPRVEITSGGPGSTGKNCCGFTMSINIKDGTLHMESEDWSGVRKVGHSTGTYYCDDFFVHHNNLRIRLGAELVIELLCICFIFPSFRA